MIEFRWKLEPPMPNKGREDRWTLQSRSLRFFIDAGGAVNIGTEAEWSEWIDVPYFSEK